MVLRNFAGRCLRGSFGNLLDPKLEMAFTTRMESIQ